MDERAAIGVTYPDPRHPLAHDQALRQRLLGLARRWFGHSGEAEELVQDAYLRTADGSLPTSASNREAWLVTVLRHLCVDAWRRNGRYQAVLAHVAAEGAHGAGHEGPENDVDRGREVDQALVSLVEALSPADAIMVMLHEVWGHTHAELGGLTGLTEVASRQRLRRAMQRLRGGRMSRVSADEEMTWLLALCRHALVHHDPAGLVAVLRTVSPHAMAAPVDQPARRVGSTAPATTCFQVGNVVGLLFQAGEGPATLIPLCEANAEAA